MKRTVFLVVPAVAFALYAMAQVAPQYNDAGEPVALPADSIAAVQSIKIEEEAPINWRLYSRARVPPTRFEQRQLEVAASKKEARRQKKEKKHQRKQQKKRLLRFGN